MKNAMTLAEMMTARDEWKQEGDWLPASGGTEVPFRTRTGRRLLYVYQPRSGAHAYLDCDSDIILAEAEVEAAGL